MQLKRLKNINIPLLKINPLQIITFVVSALSFIFVYIYVCFIIKKFLDLVNHMHKTATITKIELIVYTSLALVTIGLVVWVFTHTNAFYGSSHFYDVVYTSDSSNLVKFNVYTDIKHNENDLRQPLLAVCSGPFVGWASGLCQLFSLPLVFFAILMDSIQIVLMIFAYYTISRMLKLTPLKRILFVLLAGSSYTYILFSLMMEQYIIAFFYLIMCIYMLLENKDEHNTFYYGAGGTLLTSLIFLPLLPKETPKTNIKLWFKECVLYIVKFALIVLLFGRYDIIYNLTKKVELYNKFIGKDLTFYDKFKQYSDFITNCFISPKAQCYTVFHGY